MMFRTLGYLVLVCQLFAILCPGISLAGDEEDWNYDLHSPDGPNKWYTKYPACGGSNQSPINIDTPGAWYDPSLEYFNLSDYSVTDGISLNLVNVDGHTAEILYHGRPLYIRGGGLPGVYKLDQMHFHWGPRQSNGSEHSLDWVRYPMELHIVHHKKDLEGDDNIEKKPQGIAVLAVLFKLSKEDNVKLNRIITALYDILKSGEKVDIPSFPLREMLPASAGQRFYRYDGSLTAPPCYESVIWTIAADFLTVSENQVNKFRTLHDSQEKLAEDTHRPTQRLNGRKVRTTLRTKYVYRSTAVSDHWGGPTVVLSILLVFHKTLLFV